MNTETFLKLFQTDRQSLNRLIRKGLERGGDYCDLFFQQRQGQYVGLEDGSVNRASTSLDRGVGLRVNRGIQTGFSFVEGLEYELLKKAMANASRIAGEPVPGGGTSLPPWRTVSPASPPLYPFHGDSTFPVQRQVDLLQDLNHLVFSLDPRIRRLALNLSRSRSRVLIVSSDGRLGVDSRPMTVISAMVVAEERGRLEQNHMSIALRQGMDALDSARMKDFARRLVEQTVLLFEALPPRGGDMEVVLGAGESGILLHEAVGHGMEADFNRKGTSAFSDMTGKPVATPGVSIVDDATRPGNRGSLAIDDENVPGEKTVLVENGVLRNYLFDRLNARFYQSKSTGSGRRQSFRHHPLPRMRCTYMLPGPHTREEVIRSVKKGLYAESFTNGQVLIGAGDFTFYVKHGYLIENGRLTRPVKDVNVIGNGPEVLRKITMVADDLTFSESGWTCGKEGQGVPVSLGLPTVKVSSLTVGGRT